MRSQDRAVHYMYSASRGNASDYRTNGLYRTPNPNPNRLILTPI